MTIIRVIWASMLAAISIYTFDVIGRHGWNFVTPFFAAVSQQDWQGQFNADFLGMLILSAIWTGWRNGWSLQGNILALMALSLGAPFLCCYFLILSLKSGATPSSILLGVNENKGAK